MSFAETIRLEPLASGRHRAVFDASWGQGRALFGGIQAATLVRGFTALGIEPDRSLRTLAVHFCRAAAPGELEVEAEIVRSGGSVTQGSGRLLQDGETVATALATFARTRADGTRIDELPLPDLPAPEDLPRVEPRPFLPAFLRHVDLRFTPRSVPFQGAAEPVLEGWCRFLDPGDADAALLAGWLDIWPPAVLPTFSEPRPSASVDLRYDVLGAWPRGSAEGAEFHAFRCRALYMEDGYLVDEGGLWSRAGRPVARIRQLRVVF